MKVHILTLFPDMVRVPLEQSMMKRAQEQGHWQLNIVQIRDFAEGRHLVTDDYPYGGGVGLVMKPEPIYRAVESVVGRPLGPGTPPLAKGTRIIMMDPQGEPFTQRKAQELAEADELVLICGHYEGIDERVRAICTDELSIGDYVLTGGELGALVVTDAVIRLLPGVLAEGAAADDSFATGLLEGPQYTRPREWRGMEVPPVLVSGHHEQVRLWRREQALRRTLARRPELLLSLELTDEDQMLLTKILRQQSDKAD